MGKQKKLGLGQSLKSNIRNERYKASDRHTTSAATKDYATLASCTQENSLDSFLRTAQLADVDFTAERLNVKVITQQYSEAIPHPEEAKERKLAQLKYQTDIRIPRRPPWTKDMDKSTLDRNEKDSFIVWRKSLSIVEQNQHIILTPFEKNLEVWRQLWRVAERSEFVIQIVDARNPLFYWCSDLESYVTELDPSKQNILLVNKSDFLSEAQRKAWFEYFTSQNITVLFYSAIDELDKIVEAGEDQSKEEEEEEEEERGELEQEERFILQKINKFSLLGESGQKSTEDEDSSMSENPSTSESQNAPENEMQNAPEDTMQDVSEERMEDAPKDVIQLERKNSDGPKELSTEVSDKDVDREEELRIRKKLETGEVLVNSELLSFLAMLSDKTAYTIGLVGYPNVGKSSTLNSLLREKRVQVSSTPGKTKHFQTFKLNINGKDIVLCDCPGLVFPNLASCQSEMYCNGILPIDHMRDHVGPISYLIKTIPKLVLECVYGMKLPVPDELENGRAPYPHEVLREYGLLRGFMTTRGTPDESRAARIMLKDYVNGKLLYVKPPPGHDEINFNPICQQYMDRVASSAAKLKKTTVTMAKENVETNFFKPKEVKMCTKGRTPAEFRKAPIEGEPKPWKKHHKGNSKEKTRRKAIDLAY